MHLWMSLSAYQWVDLRAVFRVSIALSLVERHRLVWDYSVDQNKMHLTKAKRISLFLFP